MYQLKTRQICLFIIAFLPIAKFFMMNSVIATYANNDMWLSVLINLLLDYLTIFSILFLYKKTNKKFIEILKERF